MKDEEKKLRVLEAMDIYLPDVDGVINCMHNTCLNLNDKVDLQVAVPKNKKSYIDRFPYKVKRCKSIYIPIMKNYYGMPESDPDFKEEVMNGEYDIIHVHSPFNMANYMVEVAHQKNIPIVATFHSNMRLIFQDVFKVKSLAEAFVQKLGRVYNKMDEVFVCSPVVAEQCRSFGYTGKITYIPFGTELKRVENVEELALKANESFNLDENENVFIYIGRIMKLKRIDFILRSLKIVKENGIKFKFFIVGKGPKLHYLKNYAHKMGFTEKEIIFTGFLAREVFPQLLSRADLLLFPSIYDNFGLVKVECSAYKTPGLFIKDACAGYDVVDSVNGFLSEDNEEAFANKIMNAVEDRAKLKKIGENASRDLYISWAECTEQLLKRLKEIVKERESIDDNKE